MRFEKSEHLLHLAMMMQSSYSGVGLAEIQEHFEVSRRTAERMRDAILRIFPHIQETRRDDNTKAWRIISSNSLTNLQQFSVDDLAQLNTAIEMIEQQNLGQYAKNLKAIVLKLKSITKPEMLRRIEPDLEAILEAEGYAMRAGPRPNIPPETLSLLREAIKASKKVIITYHARMKGDITTRTVCPYGFLYGSRHYLIAYCDEAKDLRTFSLSNIKNITLSDEFFVRDPDFQLSRHARNAFGVFQDDPLEVIWRFDAEVANDVKEHLFHPTQTITQESDGKVTVSFTAGGIREMCWHLFTWGDRVEVIAPQILRDHYSIMLHIAQTRNDQR